MIGLTLAGVRDEPVVALDMAGDLEREQAADDTGPETEFGALLADRVGANPSTTVSELVADAVSYRARRGGKSRSVSEIRRLINSGSGNDSTGGGAAAGLDVLPAHRLPRLPGAAPTAVGPTRSGIDTLALVPAAMAGPLTPQVLAAAFGVVEQAYPLVLVDAPLDWEAPMASVAVKDADVIVLVVPALPGDLAEASATMRGSGGFPGRRADLSPMVIVAVMSVRRGRWSPQTRSAAAKLARRVDAMVRIPYDARLDDTLMDRARPDQGPVTGRTHGAGRIHGAGRTHGAGRGGNVDREHDDHTRIPFSRLKWRTRRAFLRLAAIIVDGCVDLGGTDPGNGESNGTSVAKAPTSHDRVSTPGVLSDDLRADLAPGAPGREQR